MADCARPWAADTVVGTSESPTRGRPPLPVALLDRPSPGGQPWRHPPPPRPRPVPPPERVTPSRPSWNPAPSTGSRSTSATVARARCSRSGSCRTRKVTTLATGMLGAALGANLATSLLAIVLGVAVGTVFTAFHSAQGPQLGLPQMIQSRAQFGYRGVVLICAIVVFSLVGFNMFNQMLGADVLTMTTGVDAGAGWYVLISGVAVLLAIFGYSWIHRTQSWLTALFLITFGLFTVVVPFVVPLPADALSLRELQLGRVPRAVRWRRGLRARLGAVRLRLLALSPAADEPGARSRLHLRRRVRRCRVADGPRRVRRQRVPGRRSARGGP